MRTSRGLAIIDPFTKDSMYVPKDFNAVSGTFLPNAKFTGTMAADPDVIWCAAIFGHCQSKANSRRLVLNRRTKAPMFIKSKPANEFRKAFLQQCPKPKESFTENLSITCRIFYPSNRNDLDPSLVFDCLQESGVIKNDRQLHEQHIYRFTDKANPRVEIELRRL